MASVRQEAAVLETIKVLRGESQLSDKKILAKVGYCKGIAKNPARVKKSKGWKELMDKYFPDDKIAKSVNLLLEKKATITERDVSGKIKMIRTKEIDVQAVSKGVEFAAKMKGKYADENNPTDKPQTINITQNIMNVITKAEEDIKKALIDQIKDE